MRLRRLAEIFFFLSTVIVSYLTTMSGAQKKIFKPDRILNGARKLLTETQTRRLLAVEPSSHMVRPFFSGRKFWKVNLPFVRNSRLDLGPSFVGFLWVYHGEYLTTFLGLTRPIALGAWRIAILQCELSEKISESEMVDMR